MLQLEYGVLLIVFFLITFLIVYTLQLTCLQGHVYIGKTQHTKVLVKSLC